MDIDRPVGFPVDWDPMEVNDPLEGETMDGPPSLVFSAAWFSSRWGGHRPPPKKKTVVSTDRRRAANEEVNFAPAPAPAPRRAHRPLTVRLPTSVLRRNARAKNNFSAASAAGFSASRGAEDPAALFETIRSCDAISSAAVSATIVSAPYLSMLACFSVFPPLSPRQHQQSNLRELQMLKDLSAWRK
ncbi:unnamed protein product [Umbelopsis vinacea]